MKKEKSNLARQAMTMDEYDQVQGIRHHDHFVHAMMPVVAAGAAISLI